MGKKMSFCYGVLGRFGLAPIAFEYPHYPYFQTAPQGGVWYQTAPEEDTDGFFPADAEVTKTTAVLDEALPLADTLPLTSMTFDAPGSGPRAVGAGAVWAKFPASDVVEVRFAEHEEGADSPVTHALTHNSMVTGDTIVIAIARFGGDTFDSVTDSQGNTYTLIGVESIGSVITEMTINLYVAVNATRLAQSTDSITITPTNLGMSEKWQAYINVITNVTADTMSSQNPASDISVAAITGSDPLIEPNPGMGAGTDMTSGGCLIIAYGDEQSDPFWVDHPVDPGIAYQAIGGGYPRAGLGIVSASPENTWRFFQRKDAMDVGTGVAISSGDRTGAVTETISYPAVTNANADGASRFKLHYVKDAEDPRQSINGFNRFVRSGLAYNFTDSENANSDLFITPFFDLETFFSPSEWTVGGGVGCRGDVDSMQSPFPAGKFKKLTIVWLGDFDGYTPTGARQWRVQIMRNNSPILTLDTVLGSSDRVYSVDGPSDAIDEGDLIHIHAELLDRSDTGNQLDAFYLAVMFDPS